MTSIVKLQFSNFVQNFVAAREIHSYVSDQVGKYTNMLKGKYAIINLYGMHYARFRQNLSLHEGGSNGELKCGPAQSNFLILISTMDPDNKVVPFPII